MVMICIDLTRAKLIDFIQMMERIGFIYRRLNFTAIKEQDIPIITHEMIRDHPTYRTHLFMQGYRNKFGNSHNNRVKIYGHVDIRKKKGDGNEIHYFESSETYIWKDLRLIRKELNRSKIGHFSYKDAHSVHVTIKMHNKNQRSNFKRLILNEFQEIEPGKYQKITSHRKTHLWLVQQKKYLHLVLCSEDVNNLIGKLNLEYAREEFDRLKQNVHIKGVQYFKTPVYI